METYYYTCKKHDGIRHRCTTSLSHTKRAATLYYSGNTPAIIEISNEKGDVVAVKYSTGWSKP
jgi:hypothetical protein